MDAERRCTSKSSRKVFDYAFGAESVDCHFQFIDENGNVVGEFAAHRTVLAAISPVFAVMFGSNWSKGSDKIVLADTYHEYFSEFMRYFYNDAIKLTLDNVAEIIYLAHKYELANLESECEQFMVDQLSVFNALKYFAIATRYGCIQLKESCEMLMRNKYSLIMRTAGFLQCDNDTLKNFLRIVPRQCDAVMVFDSCISWAKAECKKNGNDHKCVGNLGAALGQCFELIPFKEMRHEDFVKRYKSFKMMFTRDESEAIFMHLLGDIRNRYSLQPRGIRKSYWVAKKSKRSIRRKSLIDLRL